MALRSVHPAAQGWRLLSSLEVKLDEFKHFDSSGPPVGGAFHPAVRGPRQSWRSSTDAGNLIVDRWFGVKVEVFSIGIRPELFGFTDAARLTAIPIGG